MVELLEHPLIVLLVGALLSGLLIPSFTRRWQNHQKALEIKTLLVSDLSKSIMGIIMATQFAHLGAKSLKQEEFDQAYREWEIESAVTGTKLQAYFPNTTIPSDWSAFSTLITEFYALEGRGADVRAGHAANLAMRLGATGNQGAHDWRALKDMILEKKSALIQRVLRETVSALN